MEPCRCDSSPSVINSECPGSLSIHNIAQPALEYFSRVAMKQPVEFLKTCSSSQAECEKKLPISCLYWYMFKYASANRMVHSQRSIVPGGIPDEPHHVGLSRGIISKAHCHIFHAQTKDRERDVSKVVTEFYLATFGSDDRLAPCSPMSEECPRFLRG